MRSIRASDIFARALRLTNVRIFYPRADSLMSLFQTSSHKVTIRSRATTRSLNMLQRLSWFDFRPRTDSTHPGAQIYSVSTGDVLFRAQFAASHWSGKTSKVNRQDLKSPGLERDAPVQFRSPAPKLMGLAICRTRCWG